MIHRNEDPNFTCINPGTEQQLDNLLQRMALALSDLSGKLKDVEKEIVEALKELDTL